MSDRYELHSAIVLFILVNFISSVLSSNLVVMTFNIWESGNNVADGLNKIVSHIKAVNPDVAALQVVFCKGLIC